MTPTSNNNNNLLIFVVVAAAIVVLLLSTQLTYALTEPMPRPTIAGFNNDTVKIATDNQKRLLNIAVLHNASYNKQLAISSTTLLYTCISLELYINTINSSSIWYSLTQQGLESCDSAFSSALVNADHNSNATSYLTYPPTLFTGFKPVNVPVSLQSANKTVLDTARQYLKSRGIQ